MNKAEQMIRERVESYETLRLMSSWTWRELYGEQACDDVFVLLKVINDLRNNEAGGVTAVIADAVDATAKAAKTTRAVLAAVAGPNESAPASICRAILEADAAVKHIADFAKLLEKP